MTEITSHPPRSLLAAVIAEAQRRARRRKVVLAVGALLALLIGGGVWAGLSLTGGGPTPPPAPPGFHAVKAEGPVQHELVAFWSQSEINGVPTGRPMRSTQEIWFDRGTGLGRVRARVDGRIHDDAATFDAYDRRSLGLERLWPVDTKHFVQRTGTFRGRKVVWLGKYYNGFAPYNDHDGEWIALDPRTHEPLAWRFYGTQGYIAAQVRVLKRLKDIDPSRFWFVVRNKPPGS